MRSNLIGMCSVVAAVAVAGSASAAVIYDSMPTGPGAINPSTGKPYRTWSQPYVAWQVPEVGGKIGFSGSDRQLSSATVKMKGSSPNGETGNFNLTFNVYSVAANGGVGDLLGTRTQTFFSPAGNSSDPGYSNRPLFDCTFDLTSLNVTLPEQIYYGVAMDLNQGGVANSTNINLWNYGNRPANFVQAYANEWIGTTNNYYVDGAADLNSYANGTQVTVGTDLITGTWGRYWYQGTLYTYDASTGNVPFYTGMTPNVSISAVPAPGAIALLGVAGLAGRRRRN
jgi:MYXO-CTERM domain-containing protein